MYEILLFTLGNKSLRMRHMTQKKYHNSFSSQELFCKLSSKQSDAMGTLHQNRKGVLAKIKSAKLTKEQYVSVYADRLMIMKWKDNKEVCLFDKQVPTRIRG
jgi:hypothetical protein